MRTLETIQGEIDSIHIRMEPNYPGAFPALNAELNRLLEERETVYKRIVDLIHRRDVQLASNVANLLGTKYWPE